MGVSRDTFYRYQELAQDGNLDALINRSRRTPNIKNRVDDATENAVIDYAIAEPAHGQHRTSNELRKKGIFRIRQWRSLNLAATRFRKLQKAPQSLRTKGSRRWHRLDGRSSRSS